MFRRWLAHHALSGSLLPHHGGVCASANLITKIAFALLEYHQRTSVGSLDCRVIGNGSTRCFLFSLTATSVSSYLFPHCLSAPLGNASQSPFRAAAAPFCS